MKLLLTDCLSRKGFDIYNILRKKYDVNEIVLATSKEQKCKARIIYFNNPYILRINTKDNFFRDLTYISTAFRNDKIIFLPVEEETTNLFYKFLKENGPNNFLFKLPSYESFEIARDKYKLNKFCLEKNISAPKFFNNSNLYQWKQSEFIPLILKPRKGSGSKGIININNYAQLKTIESIQQENYVIQEKIPNGKDVIGGFFLCENGIVISSYLHKRIRTFPIEGGVSVFSKIYSNEKIINISSNLIKELNWTGLAMIEFLWDERSDTYKVIEINPRIWGSILLSEYSDANLVTNYINLCLERVIYHSKIKINSHIRWLPFDFVNLINKRGNIKGFWEFDLKNTCYINWTYSNILSSILFHLFFYINWSNFKVFKRKWKK